MERQSFEEAYLSTLPRSERFPDEHHCPDAALPFTGRAVWKRSHACSHCGSLHPEILLERLKAGTATLERTDKGYKFYVAAKPGSEPFTQTYRAEGSPQGSDPSLWEWTTRPVQSVKFYRWHLSHEQAAELFSIIHGPPPGPPNPPRPEKPWQAA